MVYLQKYKCLKALNKNLRDFREFYTFRMSKSQFMHFFHLIRSFLRDKEYQKLLRATSIILLLGTVTYHYLEGWSWIDALYFSIITLTTIGYGDFSPQTPGGKIFTIFYILVGLGIILGFINTVYLYYKSFDKKSKKD